MTAMTAARRPAWSAAAFQTSLVERGIVLVTARGAVLAHPATRLTDADRAAIHRHRAALVRLLAVMEEVVRLPPAPSRS